RPAAAPPRQDVGPQRCPPLPPNSGTKGGGFHLARAGWGSPGWPGGGVWPPPASLLTPAHRNRGHHRCDRRVTIFVAVSTRRLVRQGRAGGKPAPTAPRGGGGGGYGCTSSFAGVFGVVGAGVGGAGLAGGGAGW